MKISIVTVCYNAASSIEDTLKSVLSQTYSDKEHIVIDGGSTDGTQTIIERYRAQLAHFISERDEGIYDAMNKGIKLATGDVIGLLNADDIYAHPFVLERAAETMQQERVGAVFADAAFFHPSRPEKNVRRYSSIFFSPRMISWGWMPAHPTLFLRKGVYDRFGLFRTDFKIAGDFEFVARIFKDNSLPYKYVPGIWVRMRTGGISNRSWHSNVKLNHEVMRACRENGIRTNMLKILSKYPAKLLGFVFK